LDEEDIRKNLKKYKCVIDQFHLGDLSRYIKRGDTILFDGEEVADFGGFLYKLPLLKNAVDNGWLEVVDE